MVQEIFWPDLSGCHQAKLDKEDGAPGCDKHGKPVLLVEYSGLPALRHFFASWCINRKQDGRLELPAKTVQARVRHSSVTVTMDTYGHLFPRKDDGAELSDAAALLGTYRAHEPEFS